MPSIDLLEIIRILVLIFSVVGITISIQSLLHKLRDVHPNIFHALTEAQRITAMRSVSREMERILKFVFFIAMALANIGRSYVEHGYLRQGLAFTVLIALLLINFIMMVGTIRDKQETDRLVNIIERERAKNDNNTEHAPQGEYRCDGGPDGGGRTAEPPD